MLPASEAYTPYSYTLDTGIVLAQYTLLVECSAECSAEAVNECTEVTITEALYCHPTLLRRSCIESIVFMQVSVVDITYIKNKR